MNKILLSLFLFFSCLYSATISVHTNIPSDITAGSIYPINYTLCLNTAQNYTLNFNMTNTTYNFSLDGSEFNFTNCSYNSSLYTCPRYGSVGNNKIELNMSVNLFTQPEDYITSGFIELYSEATYGTCNPAPVVTAPSRSSGGSSGSGGGSFGFPRYYPSSLPEPIEEPVVEPEPIVDEPVEIPEPIVEPVEVVEEIEPTIIVIPADEISDSITEDAGTDIPFELIVIGGIVTVGGVLGLFFIFKNSFIGFLK